MSYSEFGNEEPGLTNSSHNILESPMSKPLREELGLFFELHMNIIDHLVTTSEWLGRDTLHPRTQTTLAACALVCRAWLPQTIQNLYYCVTLRGRRDIVTFYNTIRTRPSLATHTRILEVDSYSSPVGQFHSFALLAPYLPNLRYIRLGMLDWAAFPPKYHMNMERFEQVTALELVSRKPVFPTVSDLFRVVWSLRRLQRLIVNCYGASFERDPTAAEYERLSEMAASRPNLCADLRVLEITYRLLTTPHCPPVRAFGSNVRSLCLSFDPMGPHKLDAVTPELLKCIECFSALETMRITMGTTSIPIDAGLLSSTERLSRLRTIRRALVRKTLADYSHSTPEDVLWMPLLRHTSTSSFRELIVNPIVGYQSNLLERDNLVLDICEGLEALRAADIDILTRFPQLQIRVEVLCYTDASMQFPWSTEIISRLTDPFTAMVDVQTRAAGNY